MTISPIAEVERLHVLIELWMSGAGSDVEADATWQYFAESLGSQFEIVSPSGDVVARSQLLEGFHGARGAVPGVVIEIRAASELFSSDELAVVRYEEWQLHPSMANQRVSTAVLIRDDNNPDGWSWLTVHETSI